MSALSISTTSLPSLQVASSWGEGPVSACSGKQKLQDVQTRASGPAIILFWPAVLGEVNTQCVGQTLA